MFRFVVKSYNNIICKLDEIKAMLDKCCKETPIIPTTPKTGSISGQVLGEKRNVIQDIKIGLFKGGVPFKINNLAIESVTNSGGAFIFENIPIGDYEVKIDLTNKPYLLVSDEDETPDGDNIQNTNTTDGSIPVTVKDNIIDSNNIFIVKPNITQETASASFAEIIGVNLGILGGDIINGEVSDAFTALSFMRNHRAFDLINHSTNGRVFDANNTFADNPPEACLSDCATGIDCWGNNNGENFAAWKTRWCKWTDVFEFNTFSPEYFTLDFRSYPNKFFTPEELGDAYTAGYNYGKALTQSLDGLIQMVELGNEPHGDPGVANWQAWSRGMVTGIKEVSSTMLISSADIQNSGDEYFNGQLLNTRVSDIPTTVMDKLDYLMIHQYNFGQDVNNNNFIACINPPEVQTMNDYRSVEDEMKNMAPFVGQKKLMLGEYGYDHAKLGETTQAAYIFRTIILAMYYGFDKAMYYAGVDDPQAGEPFATIGLIDSTGKQLTSFNLLRDLVVSKGDIRVVAREADPNYEYFFKLQNSSGIYYKVFWNVADTNIPIITVY